MTLSCFQIPVYKDDEKEENRDSKIDGKSEKELFKKTAEWILFILSNSLLQEAQVSMETVKDVDYQQFCVLQYIFLIN